MKNVYDQEELESSLGLLEAAQSLKSQAGLHLQDITVYRLIESLAIHLDLLPVELDLSAPELPASNSLELIIADAPTLARVRERLRKREESVDHVHPALIAVTARPFDPAVSPELEPQEFDGVIHLPQEPGIVLAQLSVILYAHRAFVRRFQSAMEELQLNRRIFRSVTSGISVANATVPDMPLVYVNPAFEVMTGYTLEEVQGRNCRFLQAGDNDQPGLTLLREALRARREVVAIIKNYRKDGSFFWNELSISPIRNRDGEVTHFVGIQMDVTSRVEFEAALRESEKLAAVGRLAASIAHEINNPLEAVTNLLYLAHHATGIEEMRRFLALADEELQRASQITSQSLRFYKQSSKPQAVRPTEMLEAVLNLYHAKISNAGIRVQRRERMCESIVCLESEIRQVLTNLIRNAIDAMTGSAGILNIRSREATDWHSGSRGVLVTVADNGTGISPEVMSKLYTAFFTTKGIGGTGLGLWVSSEIVERHHGRLRVRSSQKPRSTWTVFQLYLPYQGLAS